MRGGIDAVEAGDEGGLGAGEVGERWRIWDSGLRKSVGVSGNVRCRSLDVGWRSDFGCGMADFGWKT